MICKQAIAAAVKQVGGARACEDAVEQCSGSKGAPMGQRGQHPACGQGALARNMLSATLNKTRLRVQHNIAECGAAAAAAGVHSPHQAQHTVAIPPLRPQTTQAGDTGEFAEQLQQQLEGTLQSLVRNYAARRSALLEEILPEVRAALRFGMQALALCFAVLQPCSTAHQRAVETLLEVCAALRCAASNSWVPAGAQLCCAVSVRHASLRAAATEVQGVLVQGAARGGKTHKAQSRALSCFG